MIRTDLFGFGVFVTCLPAHKRCRNFMAVQFGKRTAKQRMPRLLIRTMCCFYFLRFDDEEAYERYLAALSRSQRWRDQGSDELTRRLKRAPEVFKLSPTPRSLLRA